MKIVKILVGLLISVLFLFLAFRNVDTTQLKNAFIGLNWFYAGMITVVIVFSHWIRAMRWRYLLAPIRWVGVGRLFSALIIGYAANTCLPAHLGEFLRAYVLGKKRSIPASAAFATIVTERLLDMFSLIILMLIAIAVYPFPAWIKKSGWIMAGATLTLFLFMVLLKKETGKTLGLFRLLLKPFPHKVYQRVEKLLTVFLTGFVRLKRPSHYLWVGLYTVGIWLCYSASFWFGLKAFGFQLPWIAPFVMLVVTTISIVVPSSPGYVGTYHYLCQLGLGLLGIPKGPALAFAFVVHAMNIIPVFLIGLVFAWKEGVSLTQSDASIADSST
jgi:uncharacterized protein (TIRG00374 family)